MNWFQPTPGTITEIAIVCIQTVFLIYLLRLKRKTKDCYLIILLFLTSVIQYLPAFVDSSSAPAFTAHCLYIIFLGIHILSIIWCSYRFYRNTYPKECLVVVIVYAVVFGAAGSLWLKDYRFYHHISLLHILMLPSINGTAILLAAINYLRKIKLYADQAVPFSLVKELIHPSTKQIALFGGFARSLCIYIAIEVVLVLFALKVITPISYWILVDTLTVGITIVVAFAYFDYAREQTSFETKLVGITLFITLTVLSVIPLILFGFTKTPYTEKYLEAFVVIIPVSTLLISFLLPLLFRLTITKHLNQIVKGVQLVISGDLTASVNVEVNDEIGRLSENFNTMTKSLRQRTEQLGSMRETIATDFHDQTGNMLSAITRQASLLKLKLNQEHEVQPMVESIIKNSNSLYASSKDFLWHLNHNSDDPAELFDYLTGYGQLYYNQFDVAFSSAAQECQLKQFDPSAALNVIFIFKEAMTNVIKHANASEVKLSMTCHPQHIIYSLEDNGSWKEADHQREHYGLTNMERRCKKNAFGFALSKQPAGTRIEITVPVQNLNHL